MEPTTDRTDGAYFLGALILIGGLGYATFWLIFVAPAEQWAMDVIEFLVFGRDGATTEEQLRQAEALQELVDDPLGVLLADMGAFLTITVLSLGPLLAFVILGLYLKWRNQMVDGDWVDEDEIDERRQEMLEQRWEEEYEEVIEYYQDEE